MISVQVAAFDFLKNYLKAIQKTLVSTWFLKKKKNVEDILYFSKLVKQIIIKHWKTSVL